jgi:hypothetical protein
MVNRAVGNVRAQGPQLVTRRGAIFMDVFGI